MSAPRTRLGLGVLATALALGVIGDALLRAMPWGFNVTLCVLALLGAGAGLLAWSRVRGGPDTPWIALTILLLGAAFTRRAAPQLQFLDGVGLTIALALAAASVQGVGIRLLDAFDLVRGYALTAFNAIAGSLPLALREIDWHTPQQDGAPDRRWHRARAVALGALLALPLLLVFGALFMGADAVFQGFVSNLFTIDPERLASHILQTGFWTAVSAGYLRFALLARPKVRPTTPQPAAVAAPTTLGAVPVATALGLLDLLFLAFVGLQLRSLFGGAALIANTAGLTYAEYARSGFFQLAAASGLTLPVLLGADWLVRAESPEQRRTVRQLSGLLVALLGVVMASALERMRLYVAAFGLSDDRLYATAFMGYLVMLFGWFSWTMLRAQPARARFAFGGVLQGFAVLAGLHLVDPDAAIVRRNLSHPGSERPFDVHYAAAALSGDAVPPLLAALPTLPAADRCSGARLLLSRWGHAAGEDWRSWNWGRARARTLVQAQAAQLRAWACPDTVPHARPRAQEGEGGTGS